MSRICLPEEAELSRKMSVAFVIPTTAISAATSVRIMPERRTNSVQRKKGYKRPYFGPTTHMAALRLARISLRCRSSRLDGALTLLTPSDRTCRKGVKPTLSSGLCCSSVPHSIKISICVIPTKIGLWKASRRIVSLAMSPPCVQVH